MITNNFIFDWNSFWINIIAGLFFFILSIFVSIWLIPRYTVRLIRKKNQTFLIIKIGAILQELCNFLAEAPYRDTLLNFEQIAIYTHKYKKGKISENYRFVALCIINVFKDIVFPRMSVVIYDYYNSKDSNEKYVSITDEYNRLRNFRLEIERIIAIHSLHIDDFVVQKISNLCFDIKTLEIKFKDNFIYDELLEKTGAERMGIMGLNELPRIYETLLCLIKELIVLDYFEFEISKQKDN